MSTEFFFKTFLPHSCQPVSSQTPSRQYNYISKISCNFTKKACKFAITRLRHKNLGEINKRVERFQQSAFAVFAKSSRHIWQSSLIFATELNLVNYRPKTLGILAQAFCRRIFKELFSKSSVFRGCLVEHV